MRYQQVFLASFLCLACLLTPFASYAGQSMENKVLGVGINSNGNVFVNFELPLIETGCSHKQLVLAKDSEIKAQILAIGLAAQAQQATVIIKPKGCIKANPSLVANEQDWGWLYIK
jgi:hypothetical protein